MVPLANHLASAAEVLPELGTWLAVLERGKGPLATVLPFVLLLALSQVQSAQNILPAGEQQQQHQMPTQPAASAGLNCNSSGSSTSGSSGTDRSGQPGHPAKRQRPAEQPQTLASKLVSMLAEGLASDVGNVAEACILSLSKAALQSVRVEPAALADSGLQASAPSPAAAALEIVLESPARKQKAAATRLALCVSPCWNRRTPPRIGLGTKSVLSALQGIAIEWDGQPAVRCVLRAQYLHFLLVTSTALTCTLGGRELDLVMRVGTDYASPGPKHVALYLNIDPADPAEPVHFPGQRYSVEAYAVHEVQLQLLANGGRIQDRSFPASWTAGASLGTDTGEKLWAQSSVVEDEFPEGMFVCADVRLAD